MQKKRNKIQKSVYSVTPNYVADKILDIFKNNSRVTIKEVAKITGVALRTIDLKVDSLKAKGRVKRVGSTRPGHWEVFE